MRLVTGPLLFSQSQPNRRWSVKSSEVWVPTAVHALWSVDGGEGHDWVTMGRDQAQPQAERWKRDRELVNPRLKSCHSLRSGNDENGGPSEAPAPANIASG